MKNDFLAKVYLSVGVALTAISMQAQTDPIIQGYFRIQNVGNEKYVEVTGPFTAKPNLTYDQAQSSAGTIMYVEAEQDKDSYRLTHLRCQGIDVVSQEEINPDEYYGKLTNILQGAEFDGFNSIAYALVREGFTYGYTSIARATVGAVFWIVASKLETHNPVEGDGYKFYPDDYIEVAKDFNRNVTAKLDLGIRLKPVNFENKTVQVYFDVPSLKPVCDWYLDKEAMLFENTENPVSRHDVFASAMKTMSNYLATKGINLETFTAEDVKLFESWGYDIAVSYNNEKNEKGEIVLDFDRIFSDPVLLFNWIKMVGYYVLNPGENDHNLSSLGYGDIADKAKNHYLTNLLVNYLPRLHYNSRAYLINGRVGDYGTAGGMWQNADNTLGFASENEMYAAGENGQWILQPVDNENQKFVVSHKFQEVTKTAGDEDEIFGTSAVYYDFPVTIADKENTNVFNLTADLYFTRFNKMVYYYNKVEQLDNSKEIAPLTPFLIKTMQGGSSQLLVADGECKFEKIEYAPDNSMRLGDEESAKQYSVVKPLYTSGVENTSLRGVLLPTSLTNSDLANLWDGDISDIYPYSEIKVDGAEDLHGSDESHVGFSAPKTTSLDANEAVYVPSTSSTTPIEVDPEEAKEDLAKGYVYIGEPVSEDLVGVKSVEVDTPVNDNILYDLRGIRVEKPCPGNVYILNGQKIFIR